jgi:hypothetical protein
VGGRLRRGGSVLGAVLWLAAEAGEVATGVASERDEKPSAGEGGDSGGGSILKGSGGEGAPEGWAPRGGGAGAHLMGGPGVVGTAQWRGIRRQRHGRGACGRWRCRATAPGGETHAARTCMTDKRGQASARPGGQRRGAGGEHEQAGRRSTDKWGRQHSAPDSVFKLNQILFQTD